MNKTILLLTALSILSTYSQEAAVNEALLTSSKESKSSSISCKKYQYIAAASTALLISGLLISYIKKPTSSEVTTPNITTIRSFLTVAGYKEIYSVLPTGGTQNFFIVVMKDETCIFIEPNQSLIPNNPANMLNLYSFAMKQINKQEFTPDELELKKYYQSIIDDCVFLIQNSKDTEEEEISSLNQANKSMIYFSLEASVRNIRMNLPNELKQKITR